MSTRHTRRPRAAADWASVDSEVESLLDTLDEALLAHAADRVDALVVGLWKARSRVPTVLARRLVEQRARVPVFAYDLLKGFAGSRLPTILRSIYEDPTAPDLTRWAARRRAAWPARGEANARRAFMLSLRDPDSTLQEALSVASAFSPPDAEVLQEILAYLAVLPTERRQRFVELALADASPQLGWLLSGLLHIPDAMVQRAAIDAALRRREVGARGALERLALTSDDSRIREEAMVAARRLTLVGAGSEVIAGWPAVESVLASGIDGDGGQALVLIRTWEHGGQHLLVHLFHKDAWGLKDVFGFGRESDDVRDSVIDGFFEQGLPLVEIDLPLARGIVAHAVGRNAATGHAVPAAFEVWAPFFHDGFPAPPEELTVPAEVDDQPYAGRGDLVRRSRQLLTHPYFVSWLFDIRRLEPLLSLVPDWPTRHPRATQYLLLISELVDDSTRALLRSRLRRQARLLEILGERAARDVALATAASLRDDGSSSGKNPFLRAMLDTSLAALYQAHWWE